MTIEEEKTVQMEFDKLMGSYLGSNHRKKTDIIQKAYNFALHATEQLRRPSGEPYMLHPLAVAQIASAEMGLGSTTICCALLHDVVEHTDYTIDDINVLFGDKISQIVGGLTKISGGIFGDKASEQAENFKRLLLTMSEDIRVVLIKICDRLDNMRKLDREPLAKQEKIAGETLYLYAPLANRLGLNKIKTELEDLSFKFQQPEEYKGIEQKLSYTTAQRDNLFNDFTQPIRDALDRLGLTYDIKARVKSPYSIWKKMQKKHVSFDEVYDILAVRVIFDPTSKEDEAKECFNIYVELTKLYQSHPDRLRDWLSHPKANGYQALHVTLMSKQGRWIEVQIRSRRMDEIAEQGFAAHWKYKTSDDPMKTERVAEDELNGWLQTIKEILDDPQPDAMDFLDAIKLNLYASEIFVFTPKGDIITMPAGCTALDFAFQIHTEMGTHCIGAKVNHKLVPLSHKLKSGDQIEVITSESAHVQPVWINFVTTAKARNAIQTLLRKQYRELVKKGETMLNDWLESNALNLTSATLAKLTEAHSIKDHDSLLASLAKGDIQLGKDDLTVLLGKSTDGKQAGKRTGWRRYLPFIRTGKKKEEEKKGVAYLTVNKKFDRKSVIELSEDNIAQYKFCKCCRPIPGDAITAYINTNKQIEIHSASCSNVTRLQSSFGSQIMAAEWHMRGEQTFLTSIAMRGIDRKGMLKDVSVLISDIFGINIHRMEITTDDGIFTGTLELKVKDNTNLEGIIQKIMSINGMQSVYRA